MVQAETERMAVDGELKPEERINENALAQRLGQLRPDPRSPVTSPPWVSSRPSRTAAFSCARAGIFGCMVMPAAERAGAKEIAALRELVDRIDAIIPTGEVSVHYPVNLEFHERLARCCGNARLAWMYRSLVRELHIQRGRALVSGDVLPVSDAGHRAIVEAVASHDVSAAFQAGRTHILNGGLARPRQDSGHRAGASYVAGQHLNADGGMARGLL